jgi:hypothetical protein
MKSNPGILASLFNLKFLYNGIEHNLLATYYMFVDYKNEETLFN